MEPFPSGCPAARQTSRYCWFFLWAVLQFPIPTLGPTCPLILPPLGRLLPVLPSLCRASNLSCMHGGLGGRPKTLPHVLHNSRKTKTKLSSLSIQAFCSWALRLSPSDLSYPLLRTLCSRRVSLSSVLQKSLALSYHCPHSNENLVEIQMYPSWVFLDTPSWKENLFLWVCGSAVLTICFKEFRSLLPWPCLRKAFFLK